MLIPSFINSSLPRVVWCRWFETSVALWDLGALDLRAAASVVRPVRLDAADETPNSNCGGG
jgi:hypothetical protein